MRRITAATLPRIIFAAQLAAIPLFAAAYILWLPDGIAFPLGVVTGYVMMAVGRARERLVKGAVHEKAFSEGARRAHRDLIADIKRAVGDSPAQPERFASAQD